MNIYGQHRWMHFFLIKESINSNYLNLTEKDDDLDEKLIDRTHRFWGDDRNLFTRVGKVVGRSMLSTGHEGHLIFGPYISLQFEVSLVSMVRQAHAWMYV